MSTSRQAPVDFLHQCNPDLPELKWVTISAKLKVYLAKLFSLETQAPITYCDYKSKINGKTYSQKVAMHDWKECTQIIILQLVTGIQLKKGIAM